MRPVLLRLPGGFALGSYAAFYTLAWLVGPALAVWFAHRRGVPWRRAAIVYYGALAAGVIGARVFDLYIAWRFYAEEPARIWSLSFQGFSLYGGLAVACMVAILLARRLRMPVWRLADSAVPGIAAGVVLMRTGCFLRGCCYGTPTDVAWAVKYPPGSFAWSQQIMDGTVGILAGFGGTVDPVHPTQLYEMGAAILLAGIALALVRRRASDGVAFLGFALGFTLFRLGNGFLRERQPVITAPGWFYPAFYLALAAILVTLIVLRLRSKPIRSEIGDPVPPPLPRVTP